METNGHPADFIVPEFSLVKLLITRKELCIVHRATPLPLKGTMMAYILVEADHAFQAGWSDCT
jgi:hypothetical protein